MKPLKAYDKRHFDTFGEHKIFDVISIDYRKKTVLLDAGKYGEIPRIFSQVNIMQPIGIKDENKREIYEGDIVEYTQRSFPSLVRTNHSRGPAGWPESHTSRRILSKQRASSLARSTSCSRHSKTSAAL